MNIRFSAGSLYLIIFFLSAFIRLYNLSVFPPSLNWDEVSIGYNAYSILKTGRDEWGQFFPLSFRAYGDYKLPGYIYLDVPFIAIFGLNEIGVRLPSVLLGIGVVILIFLIVRHLTGDLVLSLLAMFISSLTPWLIILSRIALEAHLALFLIILSFYLFLIGLKKSKFLIGSAFALGLSLFAYNSSRVLFLPLILLAVFFSKKQLSPNKYSYISLFILMTVLIIMLPLAVFQDSSARFRWTTIIDEGAISMIEHLRAGSSLPPLVEKLIFNKATYIVPEIIKNYFSHFDPNFLFFNGGSNYQYSVPGTGLTVPILLPFLLLGVVQIIRQKLTWQYFLIGWLLVAPIPGAITRDAPHALRSLFMVVPLVIFSSLGINYFLNLLKNRLQNFFVVVLILLIFIDFIHFWNKYTGEYLRTYSWSWQYGYKQAVEFINNQGVEYDSIVFSKKYGEPHEFILFYTKYNPAKYQTDKNLKRYKKSDWYWVDQFSKFEFVNDWEVRERVENRGDLLLITSPGNYPVNGKLLKSIYFLDDNPAFDIVEL